MKKLFFTVQGSKGDEYEVTFHKEGSNVDILCSCQAGQKGIYCKHRFALLDGEIDSLLSKNLHDVEKIPDFIKGTDIEVAYKNFIEINREYEVIQNRLKSAKKALARAMYH